MVDSKLKYILGCCFSRADAKGENLRAHCFSATPQKLRPSGPLNTDLSLVHKYRCRTSSLEVRRDLIGAVADRARTQRRPLALINVENWAL
jgi:hypothetical protein